MMSTYKQVFAILNVIGIAIILVFASTYLEKMVPEPACRHGKTVLSKYIYSLFGQKYRKYMVYLCDGERRCGEWTDRVQGIVMTYFLSKLMHRQFGISSSAPVKLEKLMEPVITDWTFDESKVVHGSCAVYDFTTNSNFSKNLASMNLTEYFSEDVVYIRLDKFSWLSLYQNSLYKDNVLRIGHSTPQAFYRLIHDILRLNKRMLYQYIVYKNQFKPQVDDKLVCVLVEGQGGKLRQHDTEALWKFLDFYKSKPKTKIVMSSRDGNLLGLGIIRYSDNFMTIPGIISEFDNSNELRYRILDNMRQIVLDFHVLVQCEILIMTCGHDLGVLTAFTRHLSKGLFYLQDGKVYNTSLNILGSDHEKGTCTKA